MIAIGSYVLLAILAGVALVLVRLGSRLVTRAMKELVSRGKLTVDIASFLGSLLRGIIWVAGAVFIVTDLVRELSNNYVSYEINAYTDQPNRLITIYSDLMKNTLDTFANTGVEILSPQHIAVRESTLIVKRNQENAGKIRPRKRLST
jgi:hypothetical protein